MERNRSLHSQKHGRGTTKSNVRGAHRYPREDKGGIWYAYIPGVGRKSLGTRDEIEAEQEFKRLLQSPIARTARSEEQTLDTIAERYVHAPHGWSARTKASAALRAASFVEAMERLGVTVPSQITDEILDKWRKERMKTASAATINRDEDVARKMLRWGAEQKPTPMCNLTPLQTKGRLREATRLESPIIPSPSEIAQVATILETHCYHRGMKLLVTLAASIGFRIEEIRRLKPSAVDADGIRVAPEDGAAESSWQSKGYKERKIPVPEAVIKVAHALLDFCSVNGWRISDHSIRFHLTKACTIAGIPVFTMHDLRRTFCTESFRAGIPLVTVQEWMCHQDVQTTQRYLGKYRSDAALVAPAPAATALLQELDGVQKGYKTGAVESGNLRVSAVGNVPSGTNETLAKSAEEKGFEPLEDFRPLRFSRPPLKLIASNEKQDLKKEGTQKGTKRFSPRRKQR